MKGATAIASRELSSFFRQPAGWLIIAFYLFLTGIVFALDVLMPGRAASLRGFFEISGWLLLPVAPAISMRLISDEMRSGTIESLMTAPINTSGLVVGKFLGAVVFLLLMLAPTMVYVVLLRLFADPAPDFGPVISGYVCLLLLGVLYLAIGTFASTLTNNATLAFVVTLFTILGVLLVGRATPHAPDFLQPALLALAVTTRISDFARGIIDSTHVVFFATITMWFILMAVFSVDLRRWK